MFETRIKSLQDTLSEHEIDALIITSTYNIAYLTGIFAFSIEEREARILVTPKSIYLFTDARYTEMVKTNSPFINLIEISADKSFSKNLEEISKEEKIKSFGFEEENITYKEISLLEEKFKDLEFVPTEGIVEDLRSTKDNSEVESIKNACQLSDKAFEYILKEIKPDVTELEIKQKLENFILSNGGKLSFESIIAFGSNSAIPHHMSTNTRLKASDVILLDFGAKVDGYCSDMTRTIFIDKPKEEQSKIYHAVKEAQEIAIDCLKAHMKEGFESNKPAELANSHLREKGYTNIPHGLGHGVGLQVHETPSLSPYTEEKLIPGMIITIEPGVYIAGNCGVRIEDTALVTPDGLEILTTSSKDQIVI